MYCVSKKDTLVETEVVKKNDTLWNFCKDVTFSAASIRNRILYEWRQRYFNHLKDYNEPTMTISSATSLIAHRYAQERKESFYDSNGRTIPPGKLVSNVGRNLTQEVKSFNALMQKWNGDNHGDLTGRPNIPSYSGSHGKVKSYRAEFNNQMFTLVDDTLTTKDGRKLYKYVIMPKVYNIEFYAIHKIKHITVVRSGNHYKLLKYYDSDFIQNQEYIVSHPEYFPDNGNYLSIDLGVNNLITMVGISNEEPLQPYILSGKPLKSVNRQCYKTVGKLSAYIDDTNKRRGKGVKRQSKATHRILAAYDKRKRQSDAILHEYTSSVVNYAAENRICAIYVGYNKDITQKTRLGKRNNQMFISMCWGQLIQQLKYKAAKYGIRVIPCNESHTSKCSFLDYEKVCHHDYYAGRRIKRGLFRSSLGICWNADVNAAWNILVKNNENVSLNLDRNRVERFVVDPVVLIPCGFNVDRNDVR